MTGILAIALALISLPKIKSGSESGKGLAVAGLILGISGILFTFVLYGALFYFGFTVKDGPIGDTRKQLNEQILTQNAGSLELYKRKHGTYPEALSVATKEGFTVFPSDHYMRPIYYKASDDGQNYELRSIGPDGVYNTSDDIFPKK